MKFFTHSITQNDGAILRDNIWLQLGWRPPSEVSKNLVVPVAFSIGHGVIKPLALIPLQTCSSIGHGVIKSLALIPLQTCSFHAACSAYS
jgi:hypothetical protein